MELNQCPHCAEAGAVFLFHAAAGKDGVSSVAGCAKCGTTTKKHYGKTADEADAAAAHGTNFSENERGM